MEFHPGDCTGLGGRQAGAGWGWWQGQPGAYWLAQASRNAIGCRRSCDVVTAGSQWSWRLGGRGGVMDHHQSPRVTGPAMAGEGGGVVDGEVVKW